MSSQNPQTKYTSTFGSNDILTKLVDDFEKGFRENRRAITAAESTAVQASINTILTAVYR